MKQFILLLSLAGISGLLQAQTQRLLFERFSYNEGMPLGVVNCLLEDRDGFIWAGGTRGLARFDGHRFDAFYYNREDSCGLSAKTVNCLLQDRHGRIWVGTANGLDRLGPLRECFSKISFALGKAVPGERQIQSLLESNKGEIWVGTSAGLYLFDEKNDHLHPVFRSGGELTSGVAAICEDHQERLWIGSGSDLFRLDGQGGISRICALPDTPGMRPPAVKTIFEDGEKRLWIGTENGLFR